MTPHMCNHLDWKHCHQQMSDELPVLKCILGNTALGLMLLKDFAVTRCALTGLVHVAGDGAPHAVQQDKDLVSCVSRLL